MTSTIIMESKIVGYILGDSIGFEVKELPHMENALSIRPKLIGIDTNLTIFTQDKRFITFMYSAQTTRVKIH